MVASQSVDRLTEHQRWTAAADHYHDVVGNCTMHGTKRLVKVSNDISSFHATSYVLDVGAGTGSLARQVVERETGVRVLATDISEGMLATIDKLALPGVSTQHEDAVTLSGLADNTFTHGLSSFAIQFTPDPAACVRSLYRG